jgi:hypothetical protein
MASIAQLQKRSTAAAKKSTIAIDAEEFKERNREKWQESSNVKECKLCADKFTLTNRKHHCRECGDVFCGKCTSHQVVISGSLKRVIFSKNSLINDQLDIKILIKNLK